MADTHSPGGSHEKHVKAGEQSHKNTSSTHSASDKHESGSSQGSHTSHAGKQGGTHEQHVKAGQQSHKNG